MLVNGCIHFYELFILLLAQAVTHLTTGASVIIVALCHYHHWPSSGHTHTHTQTNTHTHTHTHTPCSQNNNVRNVLPVSPSLCLPRQMSAISNFTSLMSASVITDISRHRNNFHRQGSCNTRREIRLLERRCCGSYKMLYKILQRKISGYCFIHEIFCVS